MTDIVDRLREWHYATEDRPADIMLDAAAEIVRLRLRLADVEVSVAAFRLMVREWEF